MKENSLFQGRALPTLMSRIESDKGEIYSEILITSFDVEGVVGDETVICIYDIFFVVNGLAMMKILLVRVMCHAYRLSAYTHFFNNDDNGEFFAYSVNFNGEDVRTCQGIMM